MSVESIDDKLQHPRRSLGNRHRSQAKKYLKINGEWEDHMIFALLKEEFYSS